ncbi:hypothetical protein SDC9_109847 [bioreactor metagenome]|uniref:Lipoprotein n=1 Tax=bioreactor metagenome TaxID=1076179 RepID=A0A645BBW8_9ZZZZ
MWDALKIRNNLTKTIAKKMALVLFVMAITLAIVGCSPKPIEAIDSPPASNTPVSPEPKPAPVPHVETKSPRELELEEFLEKAPEISGLTKSISENKIVYNNEQGEYSGYYVEKTFFNGEQTDGVSLSVDVIKTIIDQKKEQGIAGSLSLPVDPNEGQIVGVEFQQNKTLNNMYFKNGFISIKSDSPIMVINSLYENDEIMRLPSSFDQGKTIDMTYFREENKNAVSGSLTFTVLENKVIDSNSNFPHQTLYTPFFGEYLCKIEGSMLMYKTLVTMDDLDNYFIHESDILKINDSLVFTMQKVVN